jgi:hypothetical protein
LRFFLGILLGALVIALETLDFLLGLVAGRVAHHRAAGVQLRLPIGNGLLLGLQVLRLLVAQLLDPAACGLAFARLAGNLLHVHVGHFGALGERPRRLRRGGGGRRGRRGRGFWRCRLRLSLSKYRTGRQHAAEDRRHKPCLHVVASLSFAHALSHSRADARLFRHLAIGRPIWAHQPGT